MEMSNRTNLNDDDVMTFGKWKGTRLGEVPDHYWRWFVRQEWASEWPDLLAYGQIVEGNDD